MVTKVLLFLFICIFATAFAFFAEVGTPGLTKARMCTCNEVEYCLYKVWKSETCSYRNISFDFVEEENGDLESLIQCSLEILHIGKSSCTNDTVYPTYLFTNEISFLNTEVMKNRNQSYCFIGEMTKCLNYESCTAWDHNGIFRLTFRVCALKHFRNKIEAMKSSTVNKFQAQAAEYDFYYIFDRPVEIMRILQINAGNLCGSSMMLIFALMMVVW